METEIQITKEQIRKWLQTDITSVGLLIQTILQDERLQQHIVETLFERYVYERSKSATENLKAQQESQETIS